VQSGKRVLKERSYLPGYVLIEAKLTGEVIQSLVNIPNVIDFLRDKAKNENRPVPLQQSEVNRILGTIDEIQETAPEVSYTIGEPVKVCDGPFSGFSGTVEEVNGDRKKLKVMVKIFGRKSTLELSFIQVEKE
jgi:transcriptional antiterminator NusG